MKIYLLIDRTALIVDDKQEKVTVEPDCAGTNGAYPENFSKQEKTE